MLIAIKEAETLLSGALRAAESGRLFSRQQANAIAESLLPLAERHGWAVSVEAVFPFRVFLGVSKRSGLTIHPAHGQPSFKRTVNGLTMDAGRDVPMQAVPLYAEALALSIVRAQAERSAA
jgi:hypothetical protein